MKAIVAILSVALVALGGSAVHLWRQLDASRQQIEDLRAQINTPAASAHRAAISAPSPSLPPAEPAAAALTAAPASDAVGKEMEILRAAMANLQSPERKANTKAAMVRMLSNQYPDVGKALGLSSAEAEQLLDLLYEQADRSSTMDPRGKDAALTARLNQTEKDELSSLLGSKYSKWEEYKEEAPTRRHVKDLSAALDAAGLPLSEAQNDSLIKTLVAEERRNSQFHEATQASGDSLVPAQFSRFTPEASRNLYSAAAAYLTPQQMETYSQVLERASAREALARITLLNGQKYAEAVAKGQR